MDKITDIPIATQSELESPTRSKTITENLYSVGSVGATAIATTTSKSSMRNDVTTNVTNIDDVDSNNCDDNNFKPRDKENSEYIDSISINDDDGDDIDGDNAIVVEPTTYNNTQNPSIITQAVEDTSHPNNSGTDDNDLNITNTHQVSNVQLDESNSNGLGDCKRQQVEKALEFLEIVRKKYTKESNIYGRFLKIMRSFKTYRLTEGCIHLEEIVDKVKILFSENYELFELFSEFVIGDKHAENMAGLINAANNIPVGDCYINSDDNISEESAHSDKTDMIVDTPPISNISPNETSKSEPIECTSPKKEINDNTINEPNIVTNQQQDEHGIVTDPATPLSRLTLTLPSQNIRVALSVPSSALRRHIYLRTNVDGMSPNTANNCINPNNVVRPGFTQPRPPLVPPTGPSSSYRNFNNFPGMQTNFLPINQFIPRGPNNNSNPPREIYHQFRDMTQINPNTQTNTTNRRFRPPMSSFGIVQPNLYHNIAPNNGSSGEIKSSKNTYSYAQNYSNKCSSSGSESAPPTNTLPVTSTSPSNSNIPGSHHPTNSSQQTTNCSQGSNNPIISSSLNINQKFSHEQPELYNNFYNNAMDFHDSFDRGAFDFVSTVKIYFADVLKKADGYQEFVRYLRDYQVQHEMCEMSTVIMADEKKNKESELLKQLMENVSNLFNHNAELINSFLHYLPSLNNSLTSTNLAPYHATSSTCSKHYPSVNVLPGSMSRDSSNTLVGAHPQMNQKPYCTHSNHSVGTLDNDIRPHITNVINQNRFTNINIPLSSLQTTFANMGKTSQLRPFQYNKNKLGSIPPAMTTTSSQIGCPRIRAPYNTAFVTNYFNVFDPNFIVQMFIEIKAVTHVKDYTNILKCIFMYNNNIVTFPELLHLIKHITHNNKIAYSKIRAVFKNVSNSRELDEIFPEIHYPGSVIIPRNHLYNQPNMEYPIPRGSNIRMNNVVMRRLPPPNSNRAIVPNFYATHRFQTPYKTSSQPPKVQHISDINYNKTTCGPTLKKSTEKDRFLNQLSDTQYSRFYLDHSKRISSSYFLISDSAPNWTCTGLNSLAASVINNECLSEAHSILEEKTTNTSTPTVTKNICEEELTRIEEERFELDVMLDLVNDILLHFKSIIENKQHTTYESVYNNGMKFFVYKVLHNLYGDGFRRVITAMRVDYLSTIKVIIPRLEQKIKEWGNSKVHLEEFWRKAIARNYLKALDYQYLTFKNVDLKRLKSKQLIKEMENVTPGSQNESPPEYTNNPYVDIEYKDKRMLSYSVHLIMYYARRQSALTSDDKGYLDKLMMHDFLPKFFDKSCYHNVNDNTSSSSSDAYVLHLFGSDDIYVFFRLHNILCERLHEMYLICGDVFLASELCKNGDQPSNASIDLTYNYPFLLSKSTQHILSSTGRVQSQEELFNFFIELVQQLLDGNIDNDHFEDECRFMFGTKSYIIFTIDKIIQECVKNLNCMVFNSSSQSLINLFTKYGDTTSISNETLDDYKIEVDNIMKPCNFYYEFVFNYNDRKSSDTLLDDGIESVWSTNVSAKISLYQIASEDKNSDVINDEPNIISDPLLPSQELLIENNRTFVKTCITTSQQSPIPLCGTGDDDENGHTSKPILDHINYENWRSYVSYFTRSDTISPDTNVLDDSIYSKPLNDELDFVRLKNIFLVRNLRESIKRLPRKASHIIERFHNLYKINTTPMTSYESEQVVENQINCYPNSIIMPPSQFNTNNSIYTNINYVTSSTSKNLLWNKSSTNRNNFHHSKVDEYSNGLVIFDNETYALEPISFKMQFLRDSQYFLYNKHSSVTSLTKFKLSSSQPTYELLEQILFSQISMIKR